MPIDVNIKCVKQKSDKLSYNNDVFVLEQLNTCQNEDTIYSDNWYIYNAVRGIGYNLFLKESTDRTFNFVDFYESNAIASYMKNMIQDEKKPNNGEQQVLQDAIVFNEKYYNAFEKLLESVIRESLVNTCIIFFRLQTPCPERYVGRISLNQFLSKLKIGEIYLNTAYIISEANYD